MKPTVLLRILVAVPLLALIAASPAGAGAPRCSGTGWYQVTTPSPSGTFNEFIGLDLSSSSEGWAVGIGAAAGQHGLVARWDGSNLNLSSGAALGDWSDTFLGAKTFSASDAWLVGESWATGSSREQVLAEHWTGSSWAVATTPIFTQHPTAQSVDGNSPTNLWAVGGFSSATYHFTPFAMRWNGSTWGAVSAPRPRHTSSSSLDDVSVLSNRNAWAVGNKQTAGGSRTLIEHWSHNRWSIVPSPNPPGGSALTGVWAAGTDDIWAVGFTNGTGTPSTKTLVMHWNGTNWKLKSSPNPGANQNALWDIDGTSPGDFWVVGGKSSSVNGIPNDSMVFEHSGGSWVEGNAAMGGDASSLKAVDATPSLPVAVGYREPVSGGTLYTLGEQHC